MSELTERDAVICNYCNNAAEYVDSSVIYGKSYGMIYICWSCYAYVGVHKGSKKPLGTLANRETREWRKKAHAVFDPIWKNKTISRGRAYRKLAQTLGKKEVHIGESSIVECQNIIAATKMLWRKL